MKLKKIASLALAGIMAVSMLAGCNGSSGNGTNPPASSSEPTTTGLVMLLRMLSSLKTLLTVECEGRHLPEDQLDKF